MKKAILIFAALLFLIANLSLADLIYFANGDIDEGFAITNGAILTVKSNDKKGKYGVPTNCVLYVKYGMWFEDLNEAERIVAESSGNMAGVEKSLTSIERMQQMNPVDMLQEQSNECIDSLPSGLRNALDNVRGGNVSTAEMISRVALLIVALILYIVSIVCSIIILIDAFKTSVIWGLLCIFVPFAFPIYFFVKYTGKKFKMFFWIVIAPILWMAIMFLMFFN